MTLAEAAAHLGLSVARTYALMRSGRLRGRLITMIVPPGRRLRRWQVEDDDVWRFVRQPAGRPRFARNRPRP